MSYIFVPYDSISSLKIKFQTLNPILHAQLPNDKNNEKQPNFVLIEPNLYYGTYGGLVFDSVLKHCNNKSFIASSIGFGYSIIWWNTIIPSFFGDVLSACNGTYVAVTPKIYEKLIVNKIHTQKQIKSSYFGPFIHKNV